MNVSAPWWRPDVFGRRWGKLQARARIRKTIRDYFAAEQFVEVETPILQRSPGNETHICAFATDMIGDDGGRGPLYLHSSPEFTCKKLLAAGVPRLFSLGPTFRNRERGRLHHPEFQMLEWYRAGGALDDLIRDCTSLMRAAADAAGTRMLRHRDNDADPFAEPEVLQVTDAFARYAQIDLACMLPDTPGGFTALRAATRRLGLRVAEDDTWSDLFSKILTARVEPHLGLGRPTFLTRYPASEAALARLCPDDARFARRFELYACGVELANAFDELRDPVEQRARFEAAEAERHRIYGETYPIDDELLAALEIMPDAVGIALGFDRLVMLATGAGSIEDVLWAPVTELAS